MLEVCKEGEMPESSSVFSSLNSVTKFTTKQRLCQLGDIFKFLQLFTPMVIFFYFCLSLFYVFGLHGCVCITWASCYCRHKKLHNVVWNWSYEWWGSIIWLLELNPRYIANVKDALKNSAISPALKGNFLYNHFEIP